MKHKYSMTQKIISGSVAFLFAASLVVPASYADREDARSVSGEALIESLPSEMAFIDAVHNGEPSKAPYVVYIQDAHSNPSAQQSIKSILGYLFEQAGDSNPLVALEGAVGNLKPEYLDFFKDYPEVNEQIRQDLLAKGELTGAELFAFDLYQQQTFNQSQFVGVEDADLYREHGNAYDQVVEQSESIEKFMGQFQRELHKPEAKILNSKLNKFLKEVSRRRDGNYTKSFAVAGTVPQSAVPQYDVYLKTLVQFSREQLSIDLDQNIEQLRFPQIFRLRAAQKYEAGLDSRKARTEWELFKSEMGDHLSQNTVDSLNAVFDRNALKFEQPLRRILEGLSTDHTEIYSKLVSYESLKQQIEVKLLQSEIDVATLFLEMDRLEYAIARSMVQSTRESLWLQIEKDYRRLGRLFRMELTSEDWSLIENRTEELSPDSLVLRLKHLGFGQSFQGDLSGFQPYEAALAFYRLAQLRDESLFRKTIRAAADNKSKLVILISGGFHAEGLQTKLEKEGYSFSIIRPVIKQTDQNQLYHRAMNGANSNIFGREDMKMASEQVALTLKEMFDVGIPHSAKLTGKTDSELADLLSQAVKTHPLLKESFDVSVTKDAAVTNNAYLVLTTPGFGASTRVKQLYTSASYGSLTSPAIGRYRLPLEFQGGRVRVASGARSEVRSPEQTYRQYGAPLSPEEKLANRHLTAEMPSLGRVVSAIKSWLTGLGKSKALSAEVKKFAGDQNRGTLAGVDPLEPGDIVITESALDGFKKAAAADSRRSTAVGGIERLATVISNADQNKYEQRGLDLVKQGKVEIVNLAGGMSLRGGIYADRFVYLPGYGKVPLLAIQILNAVKVAQETGVDNLPFAIAESDYTASKVSKAIRWLTDRNLVQREDIARFGVSIIHRIDGAGEFFAKDSLDGYAVASHFDGLLYYIITGQFARAKAAGVKYVKFSNMNIPTATFDPEMVGYLDAVRATTADIAKKPGVLIEETENRGEKGGFDARVRYQVPGETDQRVIRQVIEGYVVEGTPFYDNVVQNKDAFPVFNANSITVSLEWIESFFGLDQLGFDPSAENLENKTEFDALIAKVNERISPIGDQDPGQKIPLYLEPKEVLNPSTGEKEMILQTARLLGSARTVDPNGISYVVPRQTPNGSRYDEAKKLINIVQNTVNGTWQTYLVPQLPLLDQSDQPLPEADALVEQLNQLFIASEAAKNEAYALAFFDLHTFIINELDVRNLDQIQEYKGYLDKITSTTNIEGQIDLIETVTGSVRSEVRLAADYLSTADFIEQQAQAPRTIAVDPSVNRVGLDFGAVFPVSAAGRAAAVEYSSVPLTRPLASDETAALGEEFINTFFNPARTVLYKQNQDLVLRENVETLPAFDQGMKLWLRYLSQHRDLKWQLDADSADAGTVELFKAKLFEMAEAWGAPIAKSQIEIFVSAQLGFEPKMFDRPSVIEKMGYLSKSTDAVGVAPIGEKVNFRRIHKATALDRMIAADALRDQIPDNLRLVVGPLADLARARGFNYESLTVRFQAYERLAASA